MTAVLVDWVALVALVDWAVSVSRLCIEEEYLHSPRSRSPKSDRKYTHQDEGHLHRFSVEPEVMEELAVMAEREAKVALGPLECRLEVHHRRSCLPRIDTSARRGSHQRMEAIHMALQASTA